MDYISLVSYAISIDKLKENPRLNFKILVDENTSEVLKYFSIYKDFRISIESNQRTSSTKVKIKGSIHKYFHDGSNCTDFSFNAFKTAINSLFSELNINYSDFKVNSFEFGVNIKLPILTAQYLDNLITYDGLTPKIDTFSGNGKMYVFEKSQYLIKIYDKGLQYSNPPFNIPNDERTLRVEIRVKKMVYIKNKDIEINQLSDLLNNSVWTKLSKLLIKNLSKLVIYDSIINLNNVDTKDKMFLLESNTLNYWSTIWNNKREKQYTRTLAKFRQLVITHSKRNLHSEVLEIVKNKLDLICKDVRLLPLSEITQLSVYYPYISSNIRTNEIVRCRVTGIDITHQRGKRHYVSENTLRWLHKNKPNEFMKLLGEFGPHTYSDNVYLDIAHNIRNEYTNKYHSLKKKVLRSLNDTSLFNANEVLTLTESQKKILYGNN